MERQKRNSTAVSELCDDRMMKEHERNLAAAASRTQIGALPAEDARKLVLLIQRYRTEAVPSRGGGIGSLRGSGVRYGLNNSAGRTDTVWAACAAAGSGQTNYNFRQMRHPVPGSIQKSSGVPVVESVGAPTPSRRLQ